MNSMFAASGGATALADAIYPLNEFYARAGIPLPAIEIIRGEHVPEPWHALLVHDRDMTPTLQAHYRDEIHIEVLGRETRGDAYFREVILRLDRDQRPVEFGASRIALDALPPLVRRLVLQEQLPIGHLLKVHDVVHAGRPRAFFRLPADRVTQRAFGLQEECVLYGRRNTLWDSDGRALVEVVEILPP